MKDTQFNINSLRVAAPCSMGWENMAGDERKRFCSSCELNVYNISEMTGTEVRALIGRSPGRICGRIYRRFDGTVITRDCPTGVRALRKRAAQFAGAAFSTILGLFSVSFAQTTGNEVNGAVVTTAPETQTETQIEVKLRNERSTLPVGHRVLTGVIWGPAGSATAAAAGAEVLLFPQNYNGSFNDLIRTTSDDKGNYIFEGMPAGVYRLQVTSKDYNYAHLQDINVEDGVQLTMDVRLAHPVAFMGLIELPNVRPQVKWEPGKTVLTREELDRMPKRNLF